MKFKKLLSIFFFLSLITLPAFCKDDIIETKVGQTFKVELESNATTGYQWQLAEQLDKNILKLISSDYIAPNTKLKGAGGKEVWEFKALKAGETEISLKYVRPWEKLPPSTLKVYTVKVKR